MKSITKMLFRSRGSAEAATPLEHPSFPTAKRVGKLVATLGVAVTVASVTGQARAVNGVYLEVGKFALEKGVFNTIFAKELCSCQFVDGLTLEECQARDNLPAVSHQLVDLQVDANAKTVTSSYKGRETINAYLRSKGLGELITVGGPATAKLDASHPEFGCVLTKLPNDP